MMTDVFFRNLKHLICYVDVIFMFKCNKYPAGNYRFKVNNRNSIGLKLRIKTPEYRSGILVENELMVKAVDTVLLSLVSSLNTFNMIILYFCCLHWP